MVKTKITTEKGVVSTPGSGFEIEGLEYHEAPFKDRWSQVRSIATQGTGSSALTNERYRDTGFFMDFFRHNQTDAIFGLFQIPNSWDETTSIIPHMHIIPMAPSNGNAYFVYSHAWVTAGGLLGAGSTWTSGTLTVPLTVAQQYHIISITQSVDPPANSAPGNIFFFKLERAAENVLDTYTGSKDHETATANIAFVSIDVLFQTTRAGTVTPIP